MRKISVLVVSLCLLFTLVLSASADVIWEPYGDTFFETHRREMEYENRFYKSAAALDQYDKPNGEIIAQAVIAADELFNVQYVYVDENGEVWGNCYVPVLDAVWVNLVGCVRPYDRFDFRADYEAEFKPLAEQPDMSFYAADVPLYDYPGAPNALYSMIIEEDDSEYLPEYVHTYTDAAGNVWAETMYFRGMSGWVLLDGDIQTAAAPDKERETPIENTKNIQSSNVSAGDAEQTTSEENMENEGNTQSVTTGDVADPVAKQNYVLPIVLVAAVVAVTLAVLLIFLRKKKK